MARIGIACGGTGGHLYPGLAVAEILAGMGHEVRLYVSMKDIDRKILSRNPEFPSVPLPTIGWPGLGLKIFRFGAKFFEACRLSSSEIRNEKLAAVLGMGGFTSAPLILSASRSKVPTLLHESNAIPGKVTRWLSSKAGKVLLGFAECGDWLPEGRTVLTGTPVRSSLRRVERKAAASFWDLDPGKFTIGIIGGSQGAQGLNRLVILAMPYWEDLRDRVQFIHLTGPQECELLQANYRRNSLEASVLPFCSVMENLYSAADLVIGRSGAASLAEISLFGLASILVPYPHAAEDHQSKNASIYSDAGAARVVHEGNGSERRLAEEACLLFNNRNLLEKLAGKAGFLNPPHAARRVAEEVQNVL
ncbi:MAG: UDP-N-acetylglucosamine--N-acetylmuramyl-(pentapeptide) pyrophosphoryl-undecaprenol N-acetylglucosamine transferase [Methylacidiphilales bacterium]|nr:UDP-N-acetylglucosamine--N-acetylmuramyl-(pentapeptide) pyrophosphoryl-undecaprenol N-acetylglucosamine transferase [Candidatus Methylacidiphilales bacterium]